jgi:hypothetical protein
VKPPEGDADLAGILVKEWIPEDTTLRMSRGLSITGRVRFVPDRSLGGVQIWCRTAAGGYRIESLPRHGRFRFDGLPPGTSHLWLRTDGKVGFPYRLHELELPAGSEDVDYVVELGHRLEVTLSGWPGGSTVGQWVRLQPDGPEDPLHVTRVRLGPKLTFDGLLPGLRYSLTVCGVAGRLCAERKGIPGDSGRVVLVLEEGETISGRLVPPTGAKNVRIRAVVRGESISGRVEPDGTFTIGGLVPGTWTVHAHAKDADGETYGGRIEASTGTRVELPLSTDEE